MKNLFIYFFLINILLACSTNKNENQKMANPQFAEFLEKYWTEKEVFDAFGSTSRGETKYNAVFNNDLTKEFVKKRNDFNNKYLNELKSFDANNLNENDKLSFDVLKNDLEISLANVFENELMPIHQFWGTHLMFMQYGSGESDQPFKTVKDYENFIGRINGFPVWADTAIVNMRKGIKIGKVLPKALTLKVLPQMQEQVVNDVTKSLFWGPIKKFPTSFTLAEKNKITADFTNAIQSKIVPSFKKLAEFFEKEYLPKSRLSSGYNSLPNGKAEYEYLVKSWTTTNMTPIEIHELGLSEVARIKAEMEKIKTETGFKGDLKSFFKFTTTDPKFTPYKTPKEVLDGFHTIHETMEPQLKKLFSKVPKSKFEIRQTEKFREATASAEYMQGTIDGSRPGVFYTPIIDAKSFFYPGMESLFLHEAIPGHHYQSSLQMENTSLPTFRRYYWSGAYGEGWALYCESLGKELGIFTNPYQYFGALGDEMHRAIRLVVDTGIHSKGWSREKAIQYSMDNEPTSLQGATAEIERYMAIPGQALSYKIGALKIRQLRTKYEKELGEKFKIAAFHDKILSFGNLPLNVLEATMDAWAVNKK